MPVRCRARSRCIRRGGLIKKKRIFAADVRRWTPIVRRLKHGLSQSRTHKTGLSASICVHPRQKILSYFGTGSARAANQLASRIGWFPRVSGSLNLDAVKAQLTQEVLDNRCWGGFELPVALAGHEQQQEAVHVPRSSRSTSVRRLSLYTLRRVLSAAIFENMAISSAFLEEIYQIVDVINGNQPNLLML
jgi:hypothetical protein